MQEYGSEGSSKPGDCRGGKADSGRATQHHGDGFQAPSHQYPLMAQKSFGSASKDLPEQNAGSYCRAATGAYEASTSNQQFQNSRYSNPSVPTFSSPPNSPLVGLLFDPTSAGYSGPVAMTDRLNPDRRSQSAWSISNQEPIGTGAKKKIVKSHDKKSTFNPEVRYHERYKDNSTETERLRKQDKSLRSESTSSLDFFLEGERMVSELCNIPDLNGGSNPKQNSKGNQEDEKSNRCGSSEILLTALDKIVIHDQIPNQIVQLAIEACTDAENIAIAHHNRPCFKNIHSICAKTRSNVQKPDSAVANLHSQGIPWVIKNFIFSFVRILDGWKGVKELLSEKHDTFSRIENKYYSPNIRECFVQWQAVTKEMLTHIYKTFKCLDHGFTMEQKSFTHNYYATNSAAPRHQTQNKFQPPKPHITTPRPVNVSPQLYNAIQPPWIQSQGQPASQSFNEGPWPARSGVTYKKYPVVPPPNSHNFYPMTDQPDMDAYQRTQYKCDPCSVRETKPRQSWTITNMPDFRVLENMCYADQRELYNQLKHKMDAELGKAPGQLLLGNMPCDVMQRKDMDLKAKMIPLSHVEKTLIPSMASTSDLRGCYVQKNNSCGDTKEEADFFAAWGQMVQKEPNEFITHHSHNIQIPSNVVIPNNISGPVQFVDPENDEFHEMSKVYMKPGSYKVPIKPADPIPSFGNPQDVQFGSCIEDNEALKLKLPFPPVTLAPQPKYNMESWPCLVPRRTDDILGDDQKVLPRPILPGLDLRTVDTLDVLTALTSDRAWEAAKQSVPKFVDLLQEGSKSDTARLYDALGLSVSDECADDFKDVKRRIDDHESWPTESPSNNYTLKPLPDLWDAEKLNAAQSDCVMQSYSENDTTKNSEQDSKSFDGNEFTEGRAIKTAEAKPCPSFDHTGSCIRDDNQKKSSGKSKVAASGMWYHPKKKKPLSASFTKKFEAILKKFSLINEAAFIQHDMDIKVTYPDVTMKKNLNKVSADFERMLNDEFQMKADSKFKSNETADAIESCNRRGERSVGDGSDSFKVKLLGRNKFFGADIVLQAVKNNALLVSISKNQTMLWYVVGVAALAACVAGHGRVMEPPSRASAWRFGYPTKSNYDDDGLNCGGFGHQHAVNGGKCGICGDPYDQPQPRDHELGGIYGDGIIVAKYSAGQAFSTTVDLTVYHRGHWEFKICPDPTRNDQACFDQYLLELEEGGTKYYPIKGGRYIMNYRLPPYLACEHCVLQWTYTAGNNWGDCKNGTQGLGCGDQEHFRACSDISIGVPVAYAEDGDTNEYPSSYYQRLGYLDVKALLQLLEKVLTAASSDGGPTIAGYERNSSQQQTQKKETQRQKGEAPKEKEDIKR
ncbi:unnamed protein product, partial [Iphiclides podalirius]